MTKPLLLPLFLVALAATSAPYARAQFRLMGNAVPMSANCIQLTGDEPYNEGIAYHETKLNLNSYFEIDFDIYLGDKDGYGADGITFVIHDDPRGYEAFGTWGEGMGYGRWSRDYEYGNYIAPSIAVEFDTYQNFRQNDPECDHVAFLEGGTNYHETYWNGNDLQFNLEDGRMHNFRFKWEPTKLLITVTLDGQIVYQGRRDLINEVFGGETRVIWGFTASTGRKYNQQYFCLKSFARQ